jgi:hypothetical protein
VVALAAVSPERDVALGGAGFHHVREHHSYQRHVGKELRPTAAYYFA